MIFPTFPKSPSHMRRGLGGGVTIYILFIFLSNIYSQSPQIINDPKKDNPMLIGLSQRSDYEQRIEFKEWFKEEYETYVIDEETVELLSTVEDEIIIECYMGTWCGDSRREVPRMYKIMDQIKFNDKNLKIVSVDRDRVSPGGEQKGKNIHHVPTIIFYNKGKEIGRIIESPVGSLEEDFTDIFMGIPYTPNYVDWKPEEDK